MPKRTPTPLSSLSIADLNRELSRRRRALPALQRRLAKAQAKVDRLRAEIAALGGTAAPAGPARRRGGRTAGGVRNEGRLSDYLKRVLAGKTMTVTEAAEAVKAAGYQSSAANFRLIVNACLLNKKHGFKRVGHGQYTAG